MGKWGTGTVVKLCLQCKKEFQARVDRVGIYCNRSCAAKNKVRVSHKIEKDCVVCAKKFIVKRYRKNTALYCSQICRRLRMPKKENHSNWKGGIARTWKSKTLIKRLVKERGKCDICFSKEKLQGHHIVPYAIDKGLIEDESNIQVLCILCHASKHPEIANFILKGDIYE